MFQYQEHIHVLYDYFRGSRFISNMHRWRKISKLKQSRKFYDYFIYSKNVVLFFSNHLSQIYVC